MVQTAGKNTIRNDFKRPGRHAPAVAGETTPTTCAPSFDAASTRHAAPRTGRKERSLPPRAEGKSRCASWPRHARGQKKLARRGGPAGRGVSEQVGQPHVVLVAQPHGVQHRGAHNLHQQAAPVQRQRQPVRLDRVDLRPGGGWVGGWWCVCVSVCVCVGGVGVGVGSASGACSAPLVRAEGVRGGAGWVSCHALPAAGTGAGSKLDSTGRVGGPYSGRAECLGQRSPGGEAAEHITRWRSAPLLRARPSPIQYCAPSLPAGPPPPPPPAL